MPSTQISTTPAATPATLQPPPASTFNLFTQDWLSLQVFIAQALQLPLTTTDFGDLYGTFADETEIDKVTKAMADVRNLSTSFGDPTSLIQKLAKDPTILQSATAPADLYSHIVWFANQLYGTASTFQGTFASFDQAFGPASGLTPAQNLANLKTVLTGDGGLKFQADKMLLLTNTLIQDLAAFSASMQPMNQALQTYTGSDSQFLTDAQSALSLDQLDAQTAQDEANAAYKLWRDLTISAVCVSVGLTVLSGGLLLPAAAVAAGVLGSQAQKARDAYNADIAERDADNADAVKKARLVVDLKGFNTQIDVVNTAATNFIDTLNQVVGAWTSIGSELDAISDSLTEQQMEDFTAIMQVMRCQVATTEWQAIAAQALSYTSNSLVSFHIVPFGAKVADPA